LVVLRGGIYEVFHDIHTKFNKDWSRHSAVVWGDYYTDTQLSDLITQLLFFQSKENRLQIDVKYTEYEGMG
jgi:hypothetical protein